MNTPHLRPGDRDWRVPLDLVDGRTRPTPAAIAADVLLLAMAVGGLLLVLWSFLGATP